MLQRLQTLYLIVALIISGGLSSIFLFWKNVGGQDFFIMDLFNNEALNIKSISIVFLLSAILSLISIFSFKNRKQQIKLNRINLVANLYLLGVIVYLLLNLSGESQISEKGIGVFFPVLVIVLLVLANKSIQKDEDLVKSVDRLR